MSRIRLLKEIGRNYELYLLLAPTLIYFLIFHYGPLYGVQIAFKNFIATKGIIGSPWAGWTHFERFFNSFQFWPLLVNTLSVNLMLLLFSFPLPILLAILLNGVGAKRFKKLVQTVTFAPHFISAVVIVGMLHIFLSPRSGLVNQALGAAGIEPAFFMGDPSWFRPVFILSEVWQHTGWAAIIYLAALAGVHPETHEAAIVDGASKLRRIWHIDLPAIRPTIMILLILNIGNFMNIGFEKIYLMQNDLNLDTSEIIQTYVYKLGLLKSQYSYSAAVGLFNAVINLILLLSVNQLSRKLKQTSLW